MLNKNILDENIIALLGIESLPDDKKVAMLQKMHELLLKRVLVRVMESLGEDDQKTLASLETDPDKALEFIFDKQPNFEQILNDEIEKLKEEMVGIGDSVV